VSVADYLDLPANGLITNETTLAADPDKVQRFVDAFLRGLADTIEEPQAAYEISLDYIDGLAEADQAVQMEVLRLSIELWRADPLGTIDEGSWQNLQEVLLDMGLLTDALPLEEAVNDQFIK
jgi:NitT/TauT family transport system substrate-binding protein